MDRTKQTGKEVRARDIYKQGGYCLVSNHPLYRNSVALVKEIYEKMLLVMFPGPNDDVYLVHTHYTTPSCVCKYRSATRPWPGIIDGIDSSVLPALETTTDHIDPIIDKLAEEIAKRHESIADIESLVEYTKDQLYISVEHHRSDIVIEQRLNEEAVNNRDANNRKQNNPDPMEETVDRVCIEGNKPKMHEQDQVIIKGEKQEELSKIQLGLEDTDHIMEGSKDNIGVQYSSVSDEPLLKKKK